MSGVVCVGAQWGDEGKGKVVDLLTERADVVVRFQGGNNAGHTLVVEGVHTVLHTVPSGVLRKDKLCVIGNGVVVDPGVLLEEIDMLRARGLLADPAQLALSHQAHLILEVHTRVDRAREKYGARRIGTTGRGIGPTYEDKVARRGVRVMDLLKPDWADALRARVASANTTLAGLGAEPFTGQELEDMIRRTRAYGEALKPFVLDTVELMHRQLQAGKKVLFEGAQGALLDVDHGTYPYVTSSNTVAGAACAGSGVGPTAIRHVLGVTKAYATRVGDGPFPTELGDATGTRLREGGLEFGATTGRPRRCGWLDMVALRRAIMINGIGHLALTKLDILTGFEEIKVCVAYRLDGEPLAHWPADGELLARVQPVYRSFPGWTQDLRGATALDQLPQAAQDYVAFIVKELGVELALLSLGAGRGQEIMFKELW